MVRTVTALAFATTLSSVVLAKPALTLNRQSAPPTAAVVVSGKGFGATEAVDIYLDTTDSALASTSATGSFTGIHVSVPASAAPGEHWITGVGRHSGLSAQIAFTVNTNWPQFRGSPEHLGYNTTENMLNTTNVVGLELLWSAATNGPIDSSPAVVNGVVYVGSGDGNLYAFDARSGTKKWSAATGGAISSSPAVANGVVYVGSTDTHLWAFDAKTGAVRWAFFTGGPITSSPSVVNGVVYVGSTEGNLYSFDAATGKRRWTSGTFGPIDFSSPAVANGTVFVASNDALSSDGTLYAFDATTGSLKWTAPLTIKCPDAVPGCGVMGSPAVANGFVYISYPSSTLTAFGAATGGILWSFVNKSFFLKSSPAVANGVVYVGISVGPGIPTFGGVVAVASNNGFFIYGGPIPLGQDSSPAIANGVLYVGSYDNHLYALDAATGNYKWSAATGGYVVSSPAVANGVVYVGSEDFNLYAFALPQAMCIEPPVRPDPAMLIPDLGLSPQRP